jgi:hypothetical protein
MGVSNDYGRTRQLNWSKPMRFIDGTGLAEEVGRLVMASIYDNGIVNVPMIAEAIHRRHKFEKLFDIEHLVLGYAEFHGAPIMFDRSLVSFNDEMPVGDENEGLMLDFVQTETSP